MVDAQVILKISANSASFTQYVDTIGFERRRWTNARKLQQLRRIDTARTQNNLAPRTSNVNRTRSAEMNLTRT
jgi:hypothetical protein